MDIVTIGAISALPVAILCWYIASVAHTGHDMCPVSNKRYDMLKDSLEEAIEAEKLNKLTENELWALWGQLHTDIDTIETVLGKRYDKRGGE